MDELMDRLKFHRCYPKILEIPGSDRVRESGIGPSLFLGNERMTGGETLDMDFIDHGFMQWPAEKLIVSPVKIRADDYGFRNKGGAVSLVHRPIRVLETIGEQGLVPLDLPLNGLGVRIDEKL
jgi:hypothetical protein